jgi:zinc transporter ZupT
MKHNKIIAGLAVAGSLLAMSGAANAISPAAAIGLAAISGAAVGSVAAQSSQPAVAVVPSSPATVVMGAAPAPAVGVSGHYEVINGVYTWVPASSTVTTSVVVNYDHDADGVQNHMDRYPNDPTRS